MLEHRIATAEKKNLEIKFDIILLDVVCCRGNGFDFLPKIREICDTPVIMLTALDGEEELINGLNLGADDYKPFSARVGCSPGSSK